MDNLATALARSKGEIVFLNADGAEVAAGSSDVVTVRLEGFELLRNGAFRVVATFHHPNPPPVSKRRCKTKGGRLPPGNPRPASSDDDEAVAIRDADRIEPGLDPPENPAPGTLVSPSFLAVQLSARRGDGPHGQTRPFRLTAHDIQELDASAQSLENRGAGQ
jgi:hypothetical protein